MCSLFIQLYTTNFIFSMEKQVMTLFNNVKKISKMRGYSLREVSKLANIGETSIYSWQKKQPTASTLNKVAKVLNVSTDYLLGNTDEMLPNKSNVPSNEDLEDSLNSAVAYGGKPMTENDRAILKGLLKGYFEAKEDDK